MEHHEVTIEEVARVINGMGLKAFSKLASQLSEVNAKYGARPLGQVEAIINMIKPADFDRLLAGEVSIKIVELIRKLVDKNGRMILPAVFKSAVCDPNANFKLFQPDICYSERLNRLIRFFPGRTFLSAEEFKERSEALINQLRKDVILSNLLKGVYLPVCYPKFIINDYGKSMRNIFLKAAGDSYEDQFPGRAFDNCREGNLIGKVSVTEDSHRQLLIKMARGSIVGIQFFPLQGFSVEAARELMASLPESLHLSGAIDLAIAMTAYPDVLALNSSMPGYDCAAVSWEYNKYSLCFKVVNNKLEFNATSANSLPFGEYSAGLVFLG